MVEKGRACADDGQICGVILTDLWKAFDCRNHDLLIAKKKKKKNSKLFERSEAKN